MSRKPKQDKTPTSTKQIGEETIQASAAKELYLSLGPFRSHKKVAQLLDKSPGYVRLIEGWSAKYGWVEAAKAYDKEQMKAIGQQFKEAAQEAIDKMNEEHATLARGLHIKSVKRLNELLDSTNDKDKLWGRDSVALYKESAALERLARGEATERSEAKVDASIEGEIVIEARWGTSSLDANEENKD